MRKVILIIVAILIIAGIAIFLGLLQKAGRDERDLQFNGNGSPTPIITSVPSEMKITSIVFEDNQPIPVKYSCDGENINPPLAFSDVLGEAVSLVLIVDDPDAPGGDWVHWLLWDIDPATVQIDENSFPSEATQGTTSFGSAGYGGPCPPSGTHRYVFKLYALDTNLNLPSSVKKTDLLEAMVGHTLAQSELIGLYSR